MFKVLFLILLLAGFGQLNITTARADNGGGEVPTVGMLEARQQALESDKDLADEVRAQVMDYYTQAIDFTKQSEQLKQDYADLGKAIAAAPERLEEIQQIQQRTPLADDIPGFGSLEELEAFRLTVDTDLSVALAKEQEMQDQLAKLGSRVKTLAVDLVEGYQQLQILEQDLNAQAEPSPNEEPVVSEARNLALLARKEVRKAEIELLELLQKNQSVMNELANAELTLVGNKVQSLQERSGALTQLAQQMREQEASASLSEAEELRDSLDLLPVSIQALAENNVQLSAELEQLTRDETRVLEMLQATSTKLETIQSRFDTARQRVEIAGLTDGIGRMLEKRLATLPSLKSYHRLAEQRKTAINQATNRQLDIDELRLEYSEQPGAIIDAQMALATADQAVDADTRAAWKNKISTLVAQQQDLLDELHQLYSKHISELVELDVAERRVVETSGQFVAYIREKLFWIRSTPVLSVNDVTAMPDALSWLLSPANWLQGLSGLFDSTMSNGLWFVSGLLAALLMLLWRRPAKAAIEELGKLTIKVRTDSFALTLKTLFYTLVLVLPLPLILALVGWQLEYVEGSNGFIPALSRGLLVTSALLLLVNAYRQSYRQNGLAVRHFRRPPEICSELRKTLGQLAILLLPPVFLVAAASGSNVFEYVIALGRPAFIFSMLVLGLFVYRVLSADAPLSRYLATGFADSWLTQIRILWYPLLLLTPFVLAVLSVLGYHRTALQLTAEFFITLVVFSLLLLVRRLLLRSLYIDQRNRRFRDVLKKREELLLKKKGSAVAADADPDPAPFDIDEFEVDYQQLSEQAKRLLQTGFVLSVILALWAIWSDLLPALDVLDRVQLPLTGTEIIDGVEKQVPVTLSDIGAGLLIGFLTFVAAKNLPGVLEITLLQRLPLDMGARYAITTLTQYLIVGIGIMAIFSGIGVQWNNIQWLVAAMGVGLGFGLQEIIANFVSGLIILFERPVRVGDTVTVANLSGVVSRIRIRAITLTDWDHKEIIVPNKSFITEKLINWSLTDPITRITIPVGIAYDSDTQLAYKVIKETAEKNPLVLDEPASQLFFLGFGDSALNFELRAFVRQLDERLPALHSLHMEINNALKENKIEIPYPQRDIHIRSSGTSPV